MYGFRPFLNFKVGARPNSRSGVMLAVVLLLSPICTATSIYADQTYVQGSWAYTQRGDPDSPEHMGATPSIEDADTWLVVACSADGRLSVALVQATRFQFPIGFSSTLILRSVHLPDLPVTGKSIHANLITLDPAVMRHVLPLLLEQNQLGISVPETGGAIHDYTFSMRPNDVALAPVRARCLELLEHP